MWREELVKKYFRTWIDKDEQVLKEIFAEDVYYSECYGPEYHGIKQIEKWFKDWNEQGSVLEWNVKRYIHEGNTLVVEWYFECDYNGISGFDGVSIIEFNDKKQIVSIKEFQSKAEHYCLYEELDV